MMLFDPGWVQASKGGLMWQGGGGYMGGNLKKLSMKRVT
jgi:hypothetical protein